MTNFIFSMFFLLSTIISPLGDETPLLIVNKTTNKLALVINEQVVSVYPIATGKSKTLTPEGKFTVTLLAKDPYYIKGDIPGGDPENPLGSRWIGFNANGTDGSKYGIHGTNKPWTIGHYASSGCVRMYNKDVEKVFEHIPLGTSVYIVSSKKSWSDLVEQFYR